MKMKLINIPLFEFTRRVMQGGGISFKGMLMLPAYYIQLICSLPFMLLQWLVFGSRIRKTTIVKDPVFILGHYRSGTTYLQKLLASDDRFGVLTNYDALLPNANLLFGQQMQPFFQYMIALFSIKNPFFHDTIVRLSEPGEEDDYLMNKASAYSAYWGLVFPKRWKEWLNGETQMANPAFREGWKKEYLKTLRYLTFKNGGKQLVLKSPPNTERIRILLEMFPNAKFIYISRNPFHLYYSMHNMWKNAILKYYSLQHIPDDELDEMIFGHFEYLVDHYENDKHRIPDGHLIEIGYEELKQDPLEIIRSIYSGLHLSDFDATIPALRKTLVKENAYKNFAYTFSDETLKRIENRWGKYILEWNYKNILP